MSADQNPSLYEQVQHSGQLQEDGSSVISAVWDIGLIRHDARITVAGDALYLSHFRTGPANADGETTGWTNEADIPEEQREVIKAALRVAAARRDQTPRPVSLTAGLDSTHR